MNNLKLVSDLKVEGGKIVEVELTHFVLNGGALSVDPSKPKECVKLGEVKGKESVSEKADLKAHAHVDAKGKHGK